jgi:DNA-directed RNA polymerase subunit omega
MSEPLPSKVDSKFRFVLLAANRAEQLMRGARPKLEPANRKHTVLAMRELSQGVVGWDYGPAPQPEVPEPAEAAAPAAAQ